MKLRGSEKDIGVKGTKFPKSESEFESNLGSAGIKKCTVPIKFLSRMKKRRANIVRNNLFTLEETDSMGFAEEEKQDKTDKESKRDKFNEKDDEFIEENDELNEKNDEKEKKEEDNPIQKTSKIKGKNKKKHKEKMAKYTKKKKVTINQTEIYHYPINVESVSLESDSSHKITTIDYRNKATKASRNQTNCTPKHFGNIPNGNLDNEINLEKSIFFNNSSSFGRRVKYAEQKFDDKDKYQVEIQSENELKVPNFNQAGYQIVEEDRLNSIETLKKKFAV